MAGEKDTHKVVRAVRPYPAVFLPNEYGGWDVVFPNFPQARTFGLNFPLARENAARELTTWFTLAFKDGGVPPQPSDPAALIPDEEDPPGTRVEWIEPDKDAVLQRLGLLRRPTRMSPSGQRYSPKS